MDGDTIDISTKVLTAIGGLAIAWFQWRHKVRADKIATNDTKVREQEARAQAQRDALDQQRHTTVVGRLERIEQGQDEMRTEIRSLHKRDGELAIELERRAARIEGHLGLHGNPHKSTGGNKPE